MLTLSDPTQATLSPPANSLSESWTADTYSQHGASAILGESDAMRRLRMQVRLLGPHFRIVLLHGEAGTGKDLIARALHSCSSHARGPFVRFECGRDDSSAEELVKALKAAHRGTIYLQRISTMRREAQAALLAVLERRERVLPGPIVVHGLEARIVASATENARVAVAAGEFLHALYRRVSSVTIELPTLKERAEDIPTLARHFLKYFSPDDDSGLDELRRTTLSQWTGHHWPGNVEELKRVMQQAVEASVSNPQRMPSPTTKTMHQPVTALPGATRLQDVMEGHVFQVLKECSGNKVRAAEMLGISRSTLYRMLEAGPQGGKLAGLR